MGARRYFSQFLAYCGLGTGLPLELMMAPLARPFCRRRQEEARRIAAEAIKLGAEADKLTDAAELMEIALRMSPSLSEEYGSLLRLWRCGICSPSGTVHPGR